MQLGTESSRDPNLWQGASGKESLGCKRENGKRNCVAAFVYLITHIPACSELPFITDSRCKWHSALLHQDAPLKANTLSPYLQGSLLEVTKTCSEWHGKRTGKTSSVQQVCQHTSTKLKVFRLSHKLKEFLKPNTEEIPIPSSLTKESHLRRFHSN